MDRDSDDALFAGIEVTWVPDVEVTSIRPNGAGDGSA
jgi:hypothetical protein